MRIWVDADACPTAIKEIMIKAALRRKIPTFFIANKSIYLPASPHLFAIQVEKGGDIADQYIIDHAQKGDLVVTQDIPLAAQLVANAIITISVHGTLFDARNIGERLSIRNFLQDIRDSGGQTQGPAPFSLKDRQRFAQAFDRQLQILHKHV